MKPVSTASIRKVPVLMLLVLLMPLGILAFVPALPAQTYHQMRRLSVDVPFPPIASDALYDLDLVDLYAEFFPETSEAEIIAVLFLQANGSDPVILKCEGNFKHLEVGGDQANLSFAYDPPYFWLYNISAGAHRVRFTFRARHDGFVPAGSTIASHMLDLPGTTFWYPRNPVQDPYQLILNAVMPEGYLIEATASMTRDLPHNFRRLRTWIRAKPSADGLSLKR